MENCLFVLDDNQGLGEALAKDLDLRLIAHEVQEFENGEMKVRSSEALWSKRVFLTCSLYGDRNYSVNDKLCRLLFFTTMIFALHCLSDVTG